MTHSVPETVLKDIFQQLQENPDLTIEELVRRARFESDAQIYCPWCGSSEYSKNGRNKSVNGEEKIRFKCKKCGKSFQAATESIFNSARISLATIRDIALCMIEGKTVRETAEICGVSVPTAFLWRHKFTDCLADNAAKPAAVQKQFEESEATFFEVSYKGNHEQRPGFAIPRFVMRKQNDENVAVQQIHHTGTSHRNPSLLEMPGNMISAGQLAGNFPFSPSGPDLFINYGNLHDWVNYDLKGVASKWLPNYIAWYGFVQSYKEDEKNADAWLLSYAIGSRKRVTRRGMTKRSPVPEKGKIKEED